jgi:hypothetical protein
MSDNSTKNNQVESILFIIVGGLILGGVGVFFYQVYLWLKYAMWAPMPVATALASMGFDYYSSISAIRWAGIQKILTWLIDLPLSVCLIVLGVSLSATLNS